MPQRVSTPGWFGHVGHVVPHKLTASPDSTAASGAFQMTAVMRPVDLARSASPATAGASQRSTRCVWVSVPAIGQANTWRLQSGFVAIGDED